MKLWIGCLTIAVTTMSACLSHAQTFVIYGDQAEAADLRVAASSFLNKVGLGDLPGAQALFSGSPQQAKYLQTSVEAAVASKAVQAALVAKFGDAGKQHPLGKSTYGELMAAIAGSVDKRLFVVAGDRASLAGGGLFDRGISLQKSKGQWSVSHLDSNDFTLSESQDIAAALRDMLIEVSAGIQSGKINDLTRRSTPSPELHRRDAKSPQCPQRQSGKRPAPLNFRH